MKTEEIREQTFLILVALAKEPAHGYRIMKQVAELSVGHVTLGAGTLYGALDRLSERGWVEIERETKENGRLRRYYALTRAGMAILTREATRREELTKSVRRCIGRPLPVKVRGNS